MTDVAKQEGPEVVDKVRRILRGGGQRMIAAGAPVEDVAIGATYAAFDLAELVAGEGMAAVEWLRTAADVMERTVMAGGRDGGSTAH